ncbi:hypothetical protein D4764_22G0006680 [Takifugu flavidus]|uniref:Uncharacterized protein n=1 Tax=Takifugu flavidus TaxID=433684 RepID=A0A5C6NEP2_9TELE|nr:hypothetical protein D4764_22G0006680 [Takifugu flavidus]
MSTNRSVKSGSDTPSNSYLWDEDETQAERPQRRLRPRRLDFDSLIQRLDPTDSKESLTPWLSPPPTPPLGRSASDPGVSSPHSPSLTPPVRDSASLPELSESLLQGRDPAPSPASSRPGSPISVSGVESLSRSTTPDLPLPDDASDLPGVVVLDLYKGEVCNGCRIDHPSQRQHQCLDVIEPGFYRNNFYMLMKRLYTPKFIPAIQNFLKACGVNADYVKVKIAAETLLLELKSSKLIYTPIQQMYESIADNDSEIKQEHLDTVTQTIKTEPSNVRLSEHCDSHGLSTLPGTHGSSTLPFTRSFRTCEADKETVEGDTVGYIHSQQQHEHHESVPELLFDRVEEDTGCYIHSQHPQDKDESQEKGGQRADHHPPSFSSAGGGGLGENPSDLSPEREPRRRCQRKMEKTLDCEIIDKKDVTYLS